MFSCQPRRFATIAAALLLMFLCADKAFALQALAADAPAKSTQAAAPLQVVVRDRMTHAPIKGASVFLYKPNNPSIKTIQAITDGTGSCRFPAGFKGKYGFSVNAKGYRHTQDKITLPYDKPMTCSLAPWRKLTAKVALKHKVAKQLFVEVSQMPADSESIAHGGTVKNGSKIFQRVVDGPAYVLLVLGQDTIVDSQKIMIHGDTACSLTVHETAPVVLKLAHKPAKVKVAELILLQTNTHLPCAVAEMIKATLLPGGGVRMAMINQSQVNIMPGKYAVFAHLFPQRRPQMMRPAMGGHPRPPVEFYYPLGTITIAPKTADGKPASFDLSLTDAAMKKGVSDIELFSPNPSLSHSAVN